MSYAEHLLTACFLSLRSCSLHRLRILQLQLPGLWHWQPLQWICRFVEAQRDVYKSNVASRLIITPACPCDCDQEWHSRTLGCSPTGRCRWTGSECTCRRTSFSPRTQRRSAHKSWKRSTYRSTSLLWWGQIWWRTLTLPHIIFTNSQCLTFLCSDSSPKASHFFWGFWALIQAKYSSIDFDFLG